MFVTIVAIAMAQCTYAASYDTNNFTITAPTAPFAKQVGETAERWRTMLAREWLGHELPRWSRPCSVVVTKIGDVGAAGSTSFTFEAGRVFNWSMRVQGTPERILDSVMPHEITHMIMAERFRRPLPRWADEGAASLVEHESEQRHQTLLLQQTFKTAQRIPLRALLAIWEYPTDQQTMIIMYAEGYSLAQYLLMLHGKQRYLQFIDTAMTIGWDRAVRQCYELADVTALETAWGDWVIAGSPERLVVRKENATYLNRMASN